jgi:hypothetical protein
LTGLRREAEKLSRKSQNLDRFNVEGRKAVKKSPEFRQV